jgi:hypothetical protein
MRISWKSSNVTKSLLEAYFMKVFKCDIVIARSALSSGYNTFEKIICQCRIIDRFCERSDLAFFILGCPYFGGYYSVLLKVFKTLFTGLGT